MNISAIVHTKNSTKTVDRALKSLRWVDEIVLVDMESSDNTREIAKKHKAIILKHKDVGYVEPARNAGIKKTTGDWILIIDHDEEVPVSLAKKLRELSTKSNNEKKIFALPRRNIIFGHKVQSGGWWPDYNIRFFQKGTVSWSNKIHAQPHTKEAVHKLPAKDKFAILHYHYPTVESFISRLNRYTTIEAKNKKIDQRSLTQIFFDEFNTRYYKQKAYKDGELGEALSLLQASYQVITTLKAKDKLSTSSNIPQKKIMKNWKYWHATKKIYQSTDPLSSLYWKCRRKLKV